MKVLGALLLLPVVLVLALSMARGALAADAGAPPTIRKVVVDDYGAVKVPDPYRWLEDASDPEVRQWSAAQDRRTRAYLDGLPVRAAIHERLYGLIAAASPAFYDLRPVGSKIFAFYYQPPQEQPMVAVLDRTADPASARVVVDPNALNPKGTTAIDWFVPSVDGTQLAVSLSENGSEDGSVHLFDVATGREFGEVVPRVQYPTGGGSLAWAPDGRGFYYTRYPGPERPADEQHFYQQIFYHRLGADPARDVYVAGRDFPKVAEIHLDNAQNPRAIVASVANGDGGEFAHYVIDSAGHVTQIARFADKAVAVVLGPDDNLYIVSRENAPRGKLLKLRLGEKLTDAKLIRPETDAVLPGGGGFDGVPVVVTRKALYLRELVGGPSRIERLDHDGRELGRLPPPGIASAGEAVAVGDTVLYSVSTYLRPTYVMAFSEASQSAHETKLAQTSPVKFDDVEVSRVLVRSRDGTQIPLNIVARRGTQLDGSHPVLLTGYGGYGMSLVPRFLGAERRLWLDGGGVFAIANLRGGGEFGEAWHAAGMLTHKQNVFDDFAAAAQYFIDRHYTPSERLALIGGSNGGLLMGAMITQHPGLARAVVSQVGIYDMLRVELDPNGTFNTTEFGTVKDPDEFAALYAYSPYHHVVAGTKYPAIFMATGENDGRVNPMHSRKMTAALQAATASGFPVLLSVSSHAGHGIGSALSIRVSQSADYLAFLFDQLGMHLAPQ